MIKIKDGRTELFQWDTGSVLTVGDGIDEVHFARSPMGRSIAVPVVNGEAKVEDVLLQTAGKLFVWGFVGTAEDGYTKLEREFTVRARNKPADYVFTPPEQITLSEILEELKRVQGAVTPEAVGALVEEYLRENPVDGAVEIDATLTKEGYAADAKAVGDALSKVNGADVTAESIETALGYTPADGKVVEGLQKSVENIEYQTVTTETVSKHENLPEIEKDVTFETDGVFGDKAYINYGIDLIPKGFNRTFPWQGVTIVQKGDTYNITGQLTASIFGVFFTTGGTDQYIEFPEGLIGKTVRMLGYADTPIGNLIVNLFFYDANKTQLLKKAWYLAKDTTFSDNRVVIPDGTAYYSVQLYKGNDGNGLNHQFKLYLLVADKLEEISLLESTTKSGVIRDNFSTLPYKSYVQYKVSLNEYIVNYAGGGTVSYLTPEDFGAKGDGETDDSEAIARCIEKAYVSKQIVLMAKKYYVTTPIIISGNGISIIANDIVYDGTDTAIKISGQNSSLKIQSITSGGIGISYRGDNNQIVRYNDVDINSMYCSAHGIVFYNGLMGIFQNTVKFNIIKAGGSGFYGICMLDAEGGSWVTENNFYGGQISNCDWAVYRISGNSKLYNIQAEENVQGGFYIENGNIIIFHPRHAEGSRDGSFPFFKFKGITTNIEIRSAVSVSINEIDLSECEEWQINKNGNEYPLTEAARAVLHLTIVPARRATGENLSVGMPYCDKSYIWGKRLIMTSLTDYRKVVTTEALDTRRIDTQTYDDDDVRTLPQLPTKFVVNSVDTEIYLHASYCAIGFNKFEVEQANGCTCKIYDYDQNLIFDGAEYGDGTYKLTCYKDSELVERSGNMGSMWIPNDKDTHGRGLNQTWDVIRIGMPLVPSQQ